MIYYAGDFHGITRYLHALSQRADSKSATIIQVGDFGFGFPTKRQRKKFSKNESIFDPNNPPMWDTDDFCQWIKKRAKKENKARIITCGGNHDNWNMLYSLCREQGDSDLIELVPGSEVYYARRGAMIEVDGINHLFLGGAESTDKHKRTPSLDWWDREEPDREEFEEFFDHLNSGLVHTVVTHDAPLRVPIYRSRRSSSHTPVMLENSLALSEHKPRRWYFGHHHVLNKWDIEGTKFYCCGFHGEYWERA